MAKEFKYRISWEYTDSNGDSWSKNYGEKTADVAGTGIYENTQTIGTSEEALLVTGVDVALGGWWIVTNTDPTNFVEIRAATGVADSIKVLAGETQIFRMPADASAPFAIADTAAVKLHVVRIPL